MTAPTISATPKKALDQRATSRHDNASSPSKFLSLVCIGWSVPRVSAFNCVGNDRHNAPRRPRLDGVAEDVAAEITEQVVDGIATLGRPDLRPGIAYRGTTRSGGAHRIQRRSNKTPIMSRCGPVNRPERMDMGVGRPPQVGDGVTGGSCQRSPPEGFA